MAVFARPVGSYLYFLPTWQEQCNLVQWSSKNRAVHRANVSCSSCEVQEYNESSYGIKERRLVESQHKDLCSSLCADQRRYTILLMH